MNTVNIKEPYWDINGVGIASELFRGVDRVQMTCSYKMKNGQLKFPHLYEITTEKMTKLILKNEVKTMFRRGKKIFLLPIQEFSIREYR